ncbi:hypothetical protein B0H17DRAFT_1130917 [Mycena rosella]|uniref:Uncharacterized protein n=1 Tax=Mycena rosella TaxID=1033263 RepID=A0AAD7DPZ2_MYCRO|nr:hypothetical protein B0H17DRAFT_1130917 [Mycena rosella]
MHAASFFCSPSPCIQLDKSILGSWRAMICWPLVIALLPESDRGPVSLLVCNAVEIEKASFFPRQKWDPAMDAWVPYNGQGITKACNMQAMTWDAFAHINYSPSNHHNSDEQDPTEFKAVSEDSQFCGRMLCGFESLKTNNAVFRHDHHKQTLGICEDSNGTSYEI